MSTHIYTHTHTHKHTELHKAVQSVSVGGRMSRVEQCPPDTVAGHFGHRLLVKSTDTHKTKQRMNTHNCTTKHNLANLT